MSVPASLAFVVLSSGFAQAQPLGMGEWLQWLPEDTETVIAAPKPFRLAMVAGLDDAVSPVETLRHQAVGAMAEIPELYGRLAGRRVLWAITGISEFHPVKGLGLGRTTAVTMIRFAEPVAEAFPQSSPERFEAVRSGSPRHRPETLTLFAAVVSADTLAVATREGSLRQILARRVGIKAPFVEWPEWQFVDPTAPVSAVRHHRTRRDFENEDRVGARGLVYNGHPSLAEQTVFYRGGEGGQLARLWRGTAARQADSVRLLVRLPDEDALTGFTLQLLVELGFDVSI